MASETWLTMHEASSRLGVSPSTVRRWAATGRIPLQRTSGGHRRFDAQIIQQLVANDSRPPATTAPLEPPAWYARIAQAPGAEQMRGLGQRLLGLLIQYLVWQGDDSRFLADSREIGTLYGTAASRAGVSMSETIQAFLYFRASVWRMALQLPSVAQATDAPQMVRIAERINRFMDTVLLSTVSGYEQAPSTTPPPLATD